jgi:probable O-glycosylation ligase (exosortase A-associated)
VGAIAWGWLSFANPHREVFGFAYGQPFNLIIAIATLSGILLSRSGFRLCRDTTLYLVLALSACLIASAIFSLDPDASLPKVEEYIKTLIFMVVVAGLMNTKVRIMAMVWIIVISLGYFGTKGGLLFIASGGRHHFTGPAQSMINDRNQLALALIMAIPLMNYLRLTSARTVVRIALAAGMGLTTLAVLGTYSRGGFIALLAMGAFLWWRSRQKIVLLVLVGIIAIPAVMLVPHQWTQRMETISEAHEDDNSFRGRLLAWAYNTNAALDRPLVGAGVWALQGGACLPYMPPEGVLGRKENTCRAAHSIYFDALGSLGFPGFLAYMTLALVAWRNVQRIVTLTQNRADLLWMGDLARMIQVSFVGFFVGGAALSMTFYDVYLILVAAVSVMRVMAERTGNAAKAALPQQQTSPAYRRAI